MAIDAIEIAKLLTLYYSESPNRKLPREKNQLYNNGLVFNKEKTITERGKILIEDIINLVTNILEYNYYYDADDYVKEDGVVYAVYYSSL